MSKTNTPFRYDYVGSFLRPAELKQARADFQGGKIGADELKAVEDQAIRELVAKQQGAGYHVITDGEFRRATWHLDFMWGFHGVGHSRTEKGLPFHGENAMLDDTYLTGEVGVDSHPFVEHQLLRWLSRQQFGIPLPTGLLRGDLPGGRPEGGQ